MDIEANQPRILDRRTQYAGANWFFWLAILSALNSLAVYFVGIANTPVAFGITQWIDNSGALMNTQGGPTGLSTAGLLWNLVIAAAFAAFGYFARRGHDAIFVLGIFLYAADSLLNLGLRDFFGFCFHLVGFFFLFRGLLASRHVRENATSY